MPLAEVVARVRKTGASAIDIWPRPHGNYVEQIDKLGADKFAAMLQEHDVALGGIACYKYGPFGLDAPMKLAASVGAKQVTLVTTGRGPANAQGDALKRAVAKFVEQMKPHHEAAAERGHIIAIENHGHSMISSPDSMRHFADMTAKMSHLGLAYAPHHLPQDAAFQAALIRELGPAVKFFYAQQHGKGSRKKQPRADELLQMPGRGPLDFGPLIGALRSIAFTGYTEIFMHPFPRGVPILDTANAIVDEINRSRTYLDKFVKETRS